MYRLPPVYGAPATLSRQEPLLICAQISRRIPATLTKSDSSFHTWADMRDHHLPSWGNCDRMVSNVSVGRVRSAPYHRGKGVGLELLGVEVGVLRRGLLRVRGYSKRQPDVDLRVICQQDKVAILGCDLTMHAVSSPASFSMMSVLST